MTDDKLCTDLNPQCPFLFPRAAQGEEVEEGGLGGGRGKGGVFNLLYFSLL